VTACDLCSKPIRPQAATTIVDGKTVHLVCSVRSTQLEGMDVTERARVTVERTQKLLDEARQMLEGRHAPASDRAVAVVDDDPAVRRALARVLRAAGFTVTTFPSAEAFLRRPAGEGPAGLVLDVHLEGMSGVELRRVLLDAGLAVPTVFVTAHDVADIAGNPGAAGAAILGKPVDEDVLIEALSRAIRSDEIR
jgi:CheY-like chemotaxis protein